MTNKVLIGVGAVLVIAVGFLFFRDSTIVNNITNPLGGETNFTEGVVGTNYIKNPNAGSASAITYLGTRRCTISSGADNCVITNVTSRGSALVSPRIWINNRGGTPTTTLAKWSVSTTTQSSFTSGKWMGFATTTGYGSRLQITTNTTTAFGTQVDARVFGGATSTITVLSGENVVCGVLTSSAHFPGKNDHYAQATSTAFNTQTDCIVDIYATSTPADAR